MKILSKSFYDRSTLRVARDLLGCFLVRTQPPGNFCATKTGAGMITRRYRIVETEAYHGPRDLASHASRGRTERNNVMFGEPGFVYVYLIYGIYHMLNIVTGAKDYPAAVLIRAVESELWHVGTGHVPPPQQGRTNGPGKLTKHLKIDRSFNGQPVFTKEHGLWIEERDRIISPSRIIKTTRVGVDYAGDYKEKLWRFYIEGNKFVSRK